MLIKGFNNYSSVTFIPPIHGVECGGHLCKSFKVKVIRLNLNLFNST